MPRYSWQDDQSTIVQADVKENLHYRYAIVRPREGLSEQELAKIPTEFQSHGLIATREEEDKKPVIRVRGFDKVSDFLGELQHADLVSGKPLLKAPLEEELNPEIKSFRQTLKDHSIQIAGAVYLIADSMPIASGIARKTPSEVLSGSLFALTSIGLVLFGRKNPEVQLGNIYTRMQDFVAKEGVSMDDDAALSLQQLQRDPSYWNKMVNFLYEHPVLFNNTIQGYGCYNGHRAGVAQNNPWKNVAGLSGAAGQWGGLLIPENKYAGLDAEQRAERIRLRTTGEEPENGFNTRFRDNPIAWVSEKPLRFTAIGTIFQNFMVGGSAVFHDRHNVNEYFGFKSKKFELNPSTIFRDISRNSDDLYKASGVSREAIKADRLKAPWQRQHAELDGMLSTHLGNKFTAMSPFFNIIANTIYGMSSKEERSENLDTKGYLDEVITMAANVYSSIDEAQRGEKIVRFAGFLKSQPDVNISEHEIRARLEQKIESLGKAGWAPKAANANHAPKTEVDAPDIERQDTLGKAANANRASDQPQAAMGI
jgi:hypothetical protein